MSKLKAELDMLMMVKVSGSAKVAIIELLIWAKVLYRGERKMLQVMSYWREFQIAWHNKTVKINNTMNLIYYYAVYYAVYLKKQKNVLFVWWVLVDDFKSIFIRFFKFIFQFQIIFSFDRSIS